MGELLKAVDKSVKNGIKNGRIDPDRDAATIAMLRHMAKVLDSDETESSSVMRYVSPSSFLAYCDKLGFAPDAVKVEEKKKADKNSKLHVVGGSKWAKRA